MTIRSFKTRAFYVDALQVQEKSNGDQLLKLAQTICQVVDFGEEGRQPHSHKFSLRTYLD